MQAFKNRRHLHEHMHFWHLLKSPKTCCFSTGIRTGQQQWAPVPCCPSERSVCAQHWHAGPLPGVLRAGVLPSLPSALPTWVSVFSLAFVCFSTQYLTHYRLSIRLFMKKQKIPFASRTNSVTTSS